MWNGMGVYTADSQFDLDEQQLRKLKFTQNEINTLKYVVENFGKVRINDMMNSGIDVQTAEHVKYAYDICTGRVIIDDNITLKKHLRKMFGKRYRITINDLKPSLVSEIPRKCIVCNLNEPWHIWNSNRYKGYDALYTMVGSAGPENIKIVTDRIPILKYKQSKKEEGIAEILSKKGDKVLVALNKKKVRMCNRFIVTASLRKPEYYLYIIEIICIEGTSVYVYAIDIGGTKKSVRSTNSNRIYNWGLFEREIVPKTMEVASKIYKSLCGVAAEKEEGNKDYAPYCDWETREDVDYEDVEL
jgi:hypothetical protein